MAGGIDVVESEFELGSLFLAIHDSEVSYTDRLVEDIALRRVVSPLTNTLLIGGEWRGGSSIVLVIDDSNIDDLVMMWNMRSIAGPSLMAIPARWMDRVLSFLDRAPGDDDEDPLEFDIRTALKHDVYVSTSVNLNEMSNLQYFKDNSKNYATISPLDCGLDFYLNTTVVPPFELQTREYWDDYSIDSEGFAKISFPPLDVALGINALEVGTVAVAIEFGGRFGEEWSSVVPPPDQRDLSGLLSPLAGPTTRAGGKFCVAVDSTERWIRCRIPTGTNLVSWWLTSLGFRVDRSEAGRIADRIIQMAGGPSRVPCVCHSSAVALYDRCMTGVNYEGSERVKWVTQQQAIARLKNTEAGSFYWMNDGREAFRHLIKSKALAGGVQLKCSECGSLNWFPVSDLEDVNTCTVCLAKFPMPYDSLPKSPWRFKPCGPFAVPRRAMGSFAVALTVSRLFNQTTSQTAYANGIKLRGGDGDRDLEIDTVILRTENRGLASRAIFMECKHEQELSEQDVAKAVQLHRRFPNEFVGFACLRERLTDPEKTMIRSVLASKFENGRIRDKNLLILMDAELNDFAHNGSIWRFRKNPRAPDSVIRQLVWGTLDQMASQTRRLYLD